jgi:hypothetical protein
VLKLRDYSDIELLDNLDVKQKFRFGEEDGQYIDAITEMEKMQYCHTPREKMVGYI